MQQILVLAVCSLGLADLGYAQQPVVELEGGGGHVFGVGAGAPGPSVPTLDAAVVVWATEHWGVALRRVEGPGEDLYTTPKESLDRTFLGVSNLHYWTLTARHRQSISRNFGFEIGFGMMFDESYGFIEMFGDPPRRVSIPSGSRSGEPSVEALVTHSLARHLAVKAGVTYDWPLEANHFQPVALAVVRF